MIKRLQMKSWYEEKGRRLLKDVFPYLGLIFVLAVFSILTDGAVLKARNLIMIFKQSIIVMVGAMGSSFVLAHGNMDFSVGGSMALASLAACTVGRINPYLMLPTCIICGVLVSFLVSSIHVSIGVPAFLSTMCVMFIGKGIVQSFTGSGISAPAMYAAWDETWVYAVIMVVMLIVSVALFNYTNIGRFNKLIGSNPTAARLSGINIGKYKTLAFLLSGFSVGIAAFLTLLRSGGVSGQTGQTYEIDVIIVLTLGGAPISGGSGVKMRSSILGALTYYALSNGLILYGISPEVVFIVKGALFLTIVALTFDRSNRI